MPESLKSIGRPASKSARSVYKWAVPASRRDRIAHHSAKRRFESFMKHRLDGRYVETGPGPFPPAEIILQTLVMDDDDVRTITADRFFWSGYDQVLRWLKLLERHSFDLRAAGAVMELGCGSGRLIRQFRCVDGLRLVATDVKPEFVDWCRRDLPGIEFYVNDIAPPVTGVEAGTFDLVFAQSVFTHIPLELQEPWIQELHRVLRPGGFLLANVAGPRQQSRQLSEDERAQLEQHGHFTLDAGNENASLSTRVIGSWDVFQSTDEVVKVFSSMFDLRDYVPGGLDLLVLQKPTTGMG